MNATDLIDEWNRFDTIINDMCENIYHHITTVERGSYQGSHDFSRYTIGGDSINLFGSAGWDDDCSTEISVDLFFDEAWINSTIEKSKAIEVAHRTKQTKQKNAKQDKKLKQYLKLKAEFEPANVV